jgi:hypothetical protein
MIKATGSDYPEARAARIPATESIPMSSALPTSQPDEVALMSILRLLNRMRNVGSLSPVEHAFVMAARVMFDELSKHCDNLLGGGAGLESIPQMSVPQLPDEDGGKARAKKKPSTGGGSAQ